MDGSEQWGEGDGPHVELGVPGFYLRPDYHEVLAWMRRHAPVFTSDDGLVALSRYDDVRDVSRDPGRFVSGRGVLVNDPLRDAGGGGIRPPASMGREKTRDRRFKRYPKAYDW